MTVPTVLVFKDQKQHQEYVSGEYPNVLALMHRLKVDLFLIEKDSYIISKP